MNRKAGLRITREDLRFAFEAPDVACLCVAIAACATCAPFCKDVFSNLPKIGMIAGSVLLTVSAFYGDSYLYPATIVGFSYCAWIGAKLSPVFGQEETSSIVDDQRDSTYGGVLGCFINKMSCHPYAALDGAICQNLSKIGAVAGPVLLTVATLHHSGYLYRTAIAGLAIAGCALISIALSKITGQKIQENQDSDNTLPWVEFKRWAPVSEVLKYDGSAPSYKYEPQFLSKFFLEKEIEEFSEVRVFTNGTHLKYEMIKRTKYKWKEPKIYSGPIQMDRPINEMIEILQKCFVVLENEIAPVFSQSHLTLSGVCKIPKKNIFGSAKTKEKPVLLRLLLRQSGPVWNIYHEKDKKVFSIQGIALSKKCAEYTKKLFKKAESTSLNYQINFMKYLTLEECFRDKICLCPRAFPSGFNPNVLVSAFMWTVTLVKYQGFKGNHAQIIVEGVNDGFIPEKIIRIGEYFTCLMDLPGYQLKKDEKGNDILRNDKPKRFQSVRIDPKEKFIWHYDARSEVWKRSSEVVKEMLWKGYQEKKDPPEGFSLCGCDSIFTLKEIVEHSCITWAIEKLAIANIILEKKPLYSFATYTSFYTPFKPGQSEQTVKDAELL